MITQEKELRLLVAVVMKQFINLLDTLTCGDSPIFHIPLICRELYTEIKVQMWENVNISLCSCYLCQKLVYNFPSSQGFPCREKINSRPTQGNQELLLGSRGRDLYHRFPVAQLYLHNCELLGRWDSNNRQTCSYLEFEGGDAEKPELFGDRKVRLRCACP